MTKRRNRRGRRMTTWGSRIREEQAQKEERKKEKNPRSKTEIRLHFPENQKSEGNRPH